MNTPPVQTPSVPPTTPPASTSPSASESEDRVAVEADTSRWLSRRGALLAAAVSVGLLVVAVVVCLLIWLTPGMQALDIPEVPRG